MPGHRRDDDPDPTNRIPPLAPGGPEGAAHGSSVAGADSAPGLGADAPANDVRAADEPTQDLRTPHRTTSGVHPADQPTQDLRATQSRSGDTQSLASPAPDRTTAATPPVATREAPQPAPTPTDRTPTAPSVPPVTTTPVTGTPAPPARAGSGPAAADPARPTGPATRSEVVAAQRARYGGISWGAAFFGWLSANGVAVLLIALVSAAGVALGLTQLDAASAAANSAGAIGVGGGIALLVLLFLAYLAGGYVAGRMARFDGVKQGIAVWVIGLVAVILLALAGVVFGAQYNVLSQLNLPRIPVDEGTATNAGIIALVAVLLATLLGAILGGLLGVRYHRKVDRVGYDS
jgi:hypothetical protein